MKKKKWLWYAGLLILIVILFVPISSGTYRDGGTKVFTSLTYRIVDWNTVTDNYIYQKTRVYFFGDRFKSVDELWEKEQEHVEFHFIADVVEWSAEYAIVKANTRYGLNVYDYIALNAKTVKDDQFIND